MQGSLNSIIVWVPLIDIRPELGPLEVIPKSHKLGLCAKELVDGFGICEDTKNEDFISVEMNAGDALFFSSFLIHKSGENSSDLIRWSCHFRYNDIKDITFIERGFPTPYTYSPNPNIITPDFPSQEQIEKIFKN